MDDSELAKLYEQYGYFVHQRCLALLRKASDADDVCQEVFLRVHKYHRGDPGTATLAWLYTIALRCCHDFARRDRRDEPMDDEALASADIRRHLPDPDQTAVLGAALRQMDGKTAEIGVLYFLDGYTQEEVAVRTGYTRRTIGTKLQAFAEHLRRYGFGGFPDHE